MTRRPKLHVHQCACGKQYAALTLERFVLVHSIHLSFCALCKQPQSALHKKAVQDANGYSRKAA